MKVELELDIKQIGQLDITVCYDIANYDKMPLDHKQTLEYVHECLRQKQNEYWRTIKGKDKKNDN